jgi:hypothetical protein
MSTSKEIIKATKTAQVIYCKLKAVSSQIDSNGSKTRKRG